MSPLSQTLGVGVIGCAILGWPIAAGALFALLFLSLFAGIFAGGPAPPE